MQDTKAKLHELVEQFRYNLKDYKSSTFNETNTRQQFIDKFFALLGWDVNNEFGRAEQYKEVILEDKLKIGGQTKAPDYSFRLGGRRIFFVEAKKPSVNIKDEGDPAYQIRRYSRTAKLPIGILTDFEELAIYDTRIKPNATDKAGVARVRYCTFDQYEAERDWIYGTLSKEAVEKGAMDKYITEGKKTGTQSVDVEFLTMIDDRRLALAKNIYLRYGAERERKLERLNAIVQDIIDKIIFLRIAEGKQIEELGNLETIAKGKDIWKHLITYFQEADAKYNSGLFDNLDMFRKFDLDDKILKDILLSLYYPVCPYEFAVLGVDILGNIYEKFLGKTIVKSSKSLTTEFKPDVKKAGGVFYTPQYIVDYIVQNTVGKMMTPNLSKGSETPNPSKGSNVASAKSIMPADAIKLRIVDPACGSGAFLIGAYTYLLNRFLEQHTIDEKAITKATKENKIYTYQGSYHLAFAYKKDILTHMIYGVDIDRQAVAVSKLSLLLKLLEGETAETAGRLFGNVHASILPNLDNNIKCGNSLVGTDYFTANSQDISVGQTSKINAFDRDKAFPQVFVDGGFDCVIGNPPRGADMGIETKAYLEKKTTISSKTKDSYMYFMKWSLQITKEKGYTGLIVPNTWLLINTAKEFRKDIIENNQLIEIADYGDNVFEDATVESCVFIARKMRLKTLTCVGKTIRNQEVIENNINTENRLKEPYFRILLNINPINNGIVEKMCLKGEIFGNKCEIIRGIKPYQVGHGKPQQTREMVDNRIYHSDKKTGDERKPLLIGKNVLRYGLKSNDDLFIRYGENLMYKSDESKIIGVKILLRQTSSDIKAVIDETGFYPQNSIFIITSKEIDLKFLLGVLNSKAIDFFYKSKNPQTNKTFAEIKPSVIKELPIPSIDFSNPTQKSQHDTLVSLVDQMLTAQQNLRTVDFADEKKTIQQQIEIIDRKIDSLVFDLYGLNDEERRVVMGS